MKELKRFVVELEWSDHFEDLTNEEMGILFKNFISYHKGNDVDTTNRIVNIAWKSVVKQIDRMNVKYTNDVENGKKGGRPRKTNNPTITPKKPLNNPKVTYKDKDKEKEEYKDKKIYSARPNLHSSKAIKQKGGMKFSSAFDDILKTL
tara:strand:+ start:112 stop:555 length:444 start_codon:yes stop_codon:yes gene_type:complete